MVICSADGAGYCTNLTSAPSERVLAESMQNRRSWAAAGLQARIVVGPFSHPTSLLRMWCRRSPCDQGRAATKANPGHQTARPMKQGGPVGVDGGGAGSAPAPMETRGRPYCGKPRPTREHAALVRRGYLISYVDMDADNFEHPSLSFSEMATDHILIEAMNRLRKTTALGLPGRPPAGRTPCSPVPRKSRAPESCPAMRNDTQLPWRGAPLQPSTSFRHRCRAWPGPPTAPPQTATPTPARHRTRQPARPRHPPTAARSG